MTVDVGDLREPDRRRSRRWWWSAGVAVATVGLAAAGLPLAGRGHGEAADDGPPVTTAPVTLRDQQETAQATGSLGYGEVTPLPNHVQGTLTWAAPTGTTVRPGGVLYRVDDKPVLLLTGSTPTYRSLAVDTRGPDVRQLETSLAALGYTGFTVDDAYTDATAAAVRKWRKAVGLSAAGTVAAGEITFAPGPVRVAEHKVQPGGLAQSGQPVLATTGTAHVVTVDLKVSLQALARTGTAVTVQLPTGPAPGTVTTVGTVAHKVEGGSGDLAIPVTITLTDDKPDATIDQTPVQVRFVSDTHKGVLTVPVAALLALSEGGYGVAVVDNGRRTIVAVRTGIYAAGHVEITGDGVREGALVEVPAP
ncbi:efflux RND transporter periplasmic adaptor subunit [Longispora sp. NPDC051575]|uniref:efflux RND transporter periplasmic adaptor subunit n=1 Tax=Longispora sp. NPDC051575 TaxID=3154943 RepID=UPI00344917D7